MREAFTGCGTALVTPFKRDGAVDEAAVSRLARRQIDAGIHFLVPCGTTGESPTLTEDERVRVVELVVAEAQGRVPVLAGAGGYDTREVIHAAQRMQRAGADGILSVTPYYNKPTPRRPLPALQRDRRGGAAPDRRLQRARPDRRATSIRRRSSRLAAIPNIVGVKEASGNMTQMCEICTAVPDDFIVLSGDDALTLPLMAVGGRGIISVASNADSGARCRRWSSSPSAGDFAGARQLHRQLLPLMQVNFIESNPDPGQERDGVDGAARGGLPAADGAAASRHRRHESRPSCRRSARQASAP